MMQIPQQSTLQTDIKDFLYSNEKGDAELFARKYKDFARFDHSTDKWYLWHGSNWDEDTKREVVRLASNGLAFEYLRAAADERQKNGSTEFYDALITRAGQLRTLVRIKHVLELARSESEISLDGTEWDKNPDLFAVNNGAIDLLTGILRTPKPTEYIRYHSPVDWMGPDFPCPLWEKALVEIFDKDLEMKDFFQRYLGYVMTGHVTEHKLAILLGNDGRNGKTIIFEAMHNIFGDNLCTSLPTRVLMKNKFDSDGNRPEPYLAKLASKRLAYASESSDDMRLDTAQVKKLTGGDRINTRGMYEAPGQFTATHKLVLFTNRKPSVPPDDQAVWDRIMLIELKMRFIDNPDPKKPNEYKRDKDLGEKLKAEYPGILAWLVRGCLEWRRQGLNPPQKISVATTAYRNSEDILSEFIDDVCTVGAGHEIAVMNIFGRHKNWCLKYDIAPLGLKEFKIQMKQKFGDPVKRNHGWCYQGIR